MSTIFNEVKESLKKSELIPVTKEIWDASNSIDITFEDISKGLEGAGIPLDKVYKSEKGLYPYWFVDGFLYLPLVSLDVRFIQLYDEKYRNKEKERLNSFFKKQDFESLFDLMETQFTFDTFLRELPNIPENKIYKLFQKLYVRNDYGFQAIDKDIIRTIFKSQNNRTFESHLPIGEDGYVRVYRGMQGESAPADKAYSWTTDLRVALRFATRFNVINCSVYQAKILPEDVVDYITRRSEHEVLLLPEDLKAIEDMEFYEMDTDFMGELQENDVINSYQIYALNKLKGTWFDKPEGIHGKRHIKRVLLMSLIMSYLDDLSDEDRQILIYASLYHDIGRTNDYEDEAHGRESVKKMKDLKLTTKGLSEEEVEILEFIMKYHCINDRMGLDEVYSIEAIEDKERAIDLFNRFKDCDGLDRVRLGDLDSRYLRTETGKKMVILANQLLQNIE